MIVKSMVKLLSLSACMAVAAAMSAQAQAACSGNQGFITGSQQINESAASTQYTFNCNVSGTPSLPISWQIQSGGEYASINSSGQLTPKPIGQNRVVTVRGVDAAGASATRQITIVDNVVTLDDATYFLAAEFQANGQYYANKGSYAQKYVAIIGGNQSQLTSASGLSWSVSGGATISGGVLNTTAITTNRTLTVSATYSYTPSGYPHLARSIQVTWPSIRARAILPSTRALYGPSEVSENSVQAGTFTEYLRWDDASETQIDPQWSDNSAFASIDANGVMSTLSVTSPQTVIVSTTFAIYPTFQDYPDYSSAQTISHNSHPVTILNNKRLLTGLSISGPSTVDEKSSTAYAAMASYDEGADEEVTPVWTENSPYATITSLGVLNTGVVTANQSVNIGASYTHDGVVKTASKSVTIDNSESVLLSVEINGPASIDEGASASYTATGTFDDGSRAITPVWSGGSEHASIDANGLLSAGAVTGNEVVQINAAYTQLGVHRQASRQITVLNSESSVSGLRVVGGDNVLVGAATSRFTALADFDDAAGEVPVQAQWSVKRGNGDTINPAHAQVSISSSGVLTVSSVSQDIDIAVHASYVNTHSGGNQTVTASKALFLAVSHDGDGLTKRISVDAAGAQVGAGSGLPSVSADGRFVAFASTASDIVPNDVNGARDVFLHDRYAGEVRRLSIDFADPSAGGNGASDKPAISADGRIVAFVSAASNLVAGDGNSVQDVFVYDLLIGSVARVSTGIAGVEADDASDHPAVSADGRYIAFSSLATNLVSGDTNGRRDIFIYDRAAGLVERVSLTENGSQGNGHSQFTAVSADGRHVAFVSSATNMVSGDTNAAADIFVRDRMASTTERVSVSTAGVQSDGASEAPKISADGRYVAYVSAATNLVGGDTNGVSDVFIRDRDADTTERVSVSSAGQQGNGSSLLPSMSADGRYVSFSSDATNLVSGDTNGVRDVFVHDRDTGTTQRVSTSGGTEEASAVSSEAMLSADGLHIVFSSSAAELVPGDTNGGLDVFLRSLSPALAAPRIWLEVPSGSVDVDETFAVDLLMDFSNDPTLGGGIDLAYDGNALLFESFAADPALGADPAFSRAPDVLSVSLGGLAFGEFNGIAGARRIGTFTFTARSGGVTNLALSVNGTPMGGFYSARTMTEQAIAFSGGAVTMGGGLNALHVTSAPVTSAAVGVPYSYDVDAVAGSGGGTLTFALQTSPSGMTINGATGLIEWTPAATGSYPVVVQVSDGNASITQGYAVAVSTGSGGSGTVTHTSTEDFEAGSGNGIRAADDGLRLSPSTPDLVGLWHLDNSWADASDNGQSGTSYGGAGFTTSSKVGSHAAVFDGVDDYASWDADGLLPGGAGTNLTVSFWFKFNHWEYQALISQVGDYFWSIESAGGPMVSYLEVGLGSTYCQGSYDGNDGVWHHYALVFNDAANSLTGYMDGDLDCIMTTNLSLGPITSGNSLQMGATKDSGNNVQYHFEGALDEVAIYNRALSAGEVAALAATPAVPVGYTEEGSYLSEVIDLGTHDGLSTLSFAATTPTGTTLAVDIRAGDTATPPAWGSPNADWPSGAVITNVQSGVTDNITALGTRRYVQYRVRMTSNGDDTPVLNDISIQAESSSEPGSAPLVTSAPVRNASVGVPYSYDVDAVAGSGGGALSYTLDAAPSGMTINAGTGVIQWTPTAADSYDVVVRVSDAGAFVTQGYTLTVSGGTGGGSVTHTTEQDFSAGEGDGILVDGGGLRLSSGSPDLVGLWHLDNSWADAGGSGQGGSSYGGAGFTTSSKVGSHAAVFDGVDDYASWDADGFLPGGAGTNLTVSLWFKFEHEDYTTLISHAGDFIWAIETAGGPMLSYFQTGSGNSECYGSYEGNDDVWHHYALVFNDAANSLTGYMDGDLDCTATANFSLGPITSGNSLQMGAYKEIGDYVQYHFEGALDEVAIYNRALSAGEVAALAATPAISVGYAEEGSYLSGVIDLGAAQDLSLLVFDATTPGGTTLAVDIRAGDTATPPAWDSPSGQWPSGAMITNVQSGVTDNITALGTRRYVQYRVRMTSTGSNTPMLEEVTVHYEDEP